MLLVNQNNVVDAKSVNASLIALKKQFDANKKKLEEIQKLLANVGSGGGGGTIDAYTKQESDDRFAPISHNHNSLYYGKSEVDTLLSNKSNVGHTHSISDVTNLQTTLNGKSDTGHTHDDRYYTESEIDTKLSGKANTSHTHAISDVTNLQTTLNGKASSSHTHAISDVTNLQTTLNGKQATLVSGTNIKTVNSTSLLGSGNVAVQPTLVSGTNIKTINGSSILGSGNLVVSASDSAVETTDYTIAQGTVTQNHVYKVGKNVLGFLILNGITDTIRVNLGSSLAPVSQSQWGSGLSDAYVPFRWTMTKNSSTGVYSVLIKLNNTTSRTVSVHFNYRMDI